ncbi:MAG: indolepyruvate oxidoreductase subunit beta [Dethiobacteria bacterium]|jgi:indolepyruvate ferredoxin oxidoreductase beta subunit
MEKQKIDILIVGVGGQGTILAGKIISRLGLENGLDVKLSETHGMAQRGGSVITHVRLGKKVFSPLNSIGEVDYLVAFEQLEALRWLPYLGPKGTAIVNTQKIYPLPVLTGTQKYPEDVLTTIQKNAHRTIFINVMQETSAKMNPRTANVVLIGTLASLLKFPRKEWEKVLANTVPKKTLSLNLKAFGEGFNYR